MRNTGTVKWFDDAKGFGFITPDYNGPDLFVHFSNIQMDGHKTLVANAFVEYDEAAGPKGPSAENVVVVDG
jgi:cold shock protein